MPKKCPPEGTPYVYPVNNKEGIKYVATIRYDNDRRVCLGRYPSREEAHEVVSQYQRDGIKPPDGKNGAKPGFVRVNGTISRDPMDIANAKLRRIAGKRAWERHRQTRTCIQALPKDRRPKLQPITHQPKQTSEDRIELMKRILKRIG